MRHFVFVFLYAICQFCCNASQLENVVKHLADTEINHLKDSLKPIAQLINKNKAGTSHSYCCAIDNRNVTRENRTRLVSTEAPYSTTIIVDYKPCNVSGGNGGNQIPFPNLQQLLQNVAQSGTTPTIPTTPSGCKPDPIYQTVSYIKKFYSIEYYQVEIITQDCPIQHQICCDGYTMISGQCIANSIIANLQDLINLGLIG